MNTIFQKLKYPMIETRVLSTNGKLFYHNGFDPNEKKKFLSSAAP